MKIFKIGELSKKTGLTVEAIRYYEKLNLIEEPSRNSSGYRIYNDNTLNTLEFIQRGKKLGFTLNELKDLLNLKAPKRKAACRDVKEIADLKIEEINTKIDCLKKLNKALKKISKACCGGDDSAINCSIIKILSN
ncbi:MAG: zinc-responsive transcriptional regulator [Bacteriovorax sp. MedPE-SWde]|nr:MAG: zinc-responsive transcriptional regulator [Bacteriovorax sp. MedPE-SWde]